MGIEHAISSIVNSPAAGPIAGAGLGEMVGGPAMAGMGAMLGSGNQSLQAMAPMMPMAMGAMGMGGQQQPPAQPPPMQRPMGPPPGSAPIPQNQPLVSGQGGGLPPQVMA